MPEPAEVPDDVIEGAAGKATRLEILDIPTYAATVDHWLLDAPGQTPAWSQYILAVIRLGDIEGMAGAHKTFPEATHEVVEYALNPTEGPFDADMVTELARNGRGLPYLVPINVSVQFEATDEQARDLGKMAAWGVAEGMLAAEPPFSTSTNNERWRRVLMQTLDHIKGGHHA